MSIEIQDGAARFSLLQLTRWELWIGRFFDDTPGFSAFARQQVNVHLRTYYPDGDLAPDFPDRLLHAVLQYLIDGHLPVFEPDLQGRLAAFGIDDNDQAAADRHDILQQIIAGAAIGLVEDFQRLLQDRWALRPAHLDSTSDSGRLFRQRLDQHCAAIGELFQNKVPGGFDSDSLQDAIAELEHKWQQSFDNGGGLPLEDRQQIDRMIRAALGDWFSSLNEADLQTLRDFQRRHALLREQVRLLMADVLTLQAYANTAIGDHVRHTTGLEIDPDHYQVRTDWHGPDEPLSLTLGLAETVAQGPCAADPRKQRTLLVDPAATHGPLPAGFLDDMLAAVDPRPGYLSALRERYASPEVVAALYDLSDLRLQQSACVARYKGHLTGEGYDRVMRIREEEGVDIGQSGEKVSGVSLFPDQPLAGLMLFYATNEQPSPDWLILYAPDKPDGQEWIELPSLKALAMELGGWLRDEPGRRYLLDRISPLRQPAAEQFFAEVQQRPDRWGVRDHRAQVHGYDACSRYLIELARDNHLAQVELHEAPSWLSAQRPGARQVIAGLNEDLRLLDQAVQDASSEQETFIAFARRTVGEDTAGYLRGCGVQGPVDPGTVLFDFCADLTDAGARITRTLLDLAMYGYDDHWGLDNPGMPVRSSVGQNLGKVRAAELATYVRSAYIGERYARAIRERFLAPGTPLYARRRRLHVALARTTWLRDAHIAHARQMLDDGQFEGILGQIEQVGEVVPPTGESADSIACDGVFRLTFNGRRCVGLYVLRRIIDGAAQDWLYSPQAPDGIAFRKYKAFTGALPGVMHEYWLQHVRYIDRPGASRWLTGLAKGEFTRDSLREGQRVCDFHGEYDEYLESHISDIDAVTRSRHEVIIEQVTKGLLYAAIPLSLAFPPLGFALDAVFLAAGVTKAVRSHIGNDDSEALAHWLGVAASLWGLATPGVWGAVSHAARAGSRRVGQVSLVTQVSDRLRPGVRQGERSLFDALTDQRAVRKVPDTLRKLEKDGVWKGVYQHRDEGGQDSFYVMDGGRYFQVVHDADHQTLRLLDPRYPRAQYKMPIRAGAGGRWQFNEGVGLKGGGRDTRYLGLVRRVAEAFPARSQPVPVRGALQGEGVIARFNPAAADNYLYSLNAQSCVVASLYNPATRQGAVIHFDHNINRLIEETLGTALTRIGVEGSDSGIQASLVGGDWLSTGASIGNPIRAILARRGIQAGWDHWSYSSCLGNIYGVRLDLADGATTVFTTTRSGVQDVLDPLLYDAVRMPGSAMAERGQRFIARFRQDVLVQQGNGAVTSLRGEPATPSQIEGQSLLLTVLGD